MKRPLELMAEIQDKDAEIAAMAKLAVLLKVDIAEKDAEIERLKEEEAKVVKELQALARLVDSLIAEKGAEIERLKVFESRYREEYEIVKRIWELIGFDEYNSKGSPEKSIFDYIQGYKDLLARAAEALERTREELMYPSLVSRARHDYSGLIAELRKAAQ